VAYYVYLKETPKRTRNFPLFSLLLITAGFGILTWVVFPIVNWEFNKKDELQINSQVLGQSFQDISVQTDSDGFSYFIPAKDFTRRSSVKEFKLSVGKLTIENARVVVDSLDFKKSLAHYPQTALPGEVGNVFITGHSSLPQISDPNDYGSIFSKLSALENGDKVEVDVSGIVYRYEVIKMSVVDPKNISILYPPDKTGRYLTLMTCVPPGLNTQRLAVLTKLIDNPLESESF